MNASIVIPAYKPDKDTLSKIVSSIKQQKLDGKLEILIVDKNWGFAKQVNYGIKNSKYDLIIVLGQDCIPIGIDWAKKLLAPFEDKEVLATVSKVTYPKILWDKNSILTKSLIIKEEGTYHSLLDGKGCAYRKSILEKVGLFDEERFRTGGEDFDMYLKLKTLGKIAYPDVNLIHMHPTTFKTRLRKNYQYSNGYGALVRIHGTKMHHWYFGLINAIPIIGIFSFIAGYPFKRGFKLFFPFCFVAFVNHPYYVMGFWKGFIEGKQTA
jgi:GT2 family glycosyltransferase